MSAPIFVQVAYSSFVNINDIRTVFLKTINNVTELYIEFIGSAPDADYIFTVKPEYRRAVCEALSCHIGKDGHFNRELRAMGG
jgi:hypothetical protein